MRTLPLIDEFSREGVSIGMAWRQDGEDVAGRSTPLLFRLGTQAFLRIDNGPEFKYGRISNGLPQVEAGTLFIDAGRPRESR